MGYPPDGIQHGERAKVLVERKVRGRVVGGKNVETPGRCSGPGERDGLPWLRITRDAESDSEDEVEEGERSENGELHGWFEGGGG